MNSFETGEWIDIDRDGHRRRTPGAEEIARRGSFLLTLIAALWLLSCATTAPAVLPSEPIPESPESAQATTHLVIDLGSSGSRFCLYAVERLPGQRGCALLPSKPVCSRVQGGLAKLSRDRSPSEISGVIEPQLRSAWTQLGNPADGADRALRKNVRAAVALGTGGFRDRTTGKPLARPEWRVLFTAVERFLRAETGAATAVARAITGEEEGRLAWLGLAQQSARPDEFALIEAGGATIQLAVGSTRRSPAVVEAATDAQGQDSVFERFLSKASLARRFRVCYSPRNPRRQDGPRCIELLSREIFQNSAVRRLAQQSSARQLYGLGLSFADLFRSYPAAPPWPKKEDAVMHARFSIDHIRELAGILCPRTAAEIRELAPNTLALKREPASDPSAGKRVCYYLSYRAALLESIRPVAAGAELFSAGEDQWSRGAAVSGEFFPACR